MFEVIILQKNQVVEQSANASEVFLSVELGHDVMAGLTATLVRIQSCSMNWATTALGRNPGGGDENFRHDMGLAEIQESQSCH